MSWIEFNKNLINLDKVSYISYTDYNITIVTDDCKFGHSFSDEKAVPIIERLKEDLNITFEVDMYERE